MKTAAVISGLLLICCEISNWTTAKGELGGLLQWACRDRYLWIQVASGLTPQFQAIDENGVHAISEQLASRCGYTISTLKMGGFTNFRASYFSCFTHNQDDQVFTFRFNVMVRDGDGWLNQSVSAACSGLSWTDREVICEEDYMEVNIDGESLCEGQQGGSSSSSSSSSRRLLLAAISQAQRTARSTWQLMFLQRDGQVTSMSVSEAQTRGYSLSASAARVVLRSSYSLPHSALEMVDGVPVEVVQVSLFFKQKLTVVMFDLSMACPVNSGSFDGAHLLWDVPQVLPLLVGEGATFESQSLRVEDVLLGDPTNTTRNISLVQQGGLVQVLVPFGAEGGYRKSFVVNNVYKETYVVLLLYEHIFSLLYEDGSSIDTRHRTLRLLETPLFCRPPFSLDKTLSDERVFSIFLGNVPADVILEDVSINGKRLLTEAAAQRLNVSSALHHNGSKAFHVRLAFEDASVDRMYLGEGVMQYSIDANFSLIILPQRESYYHHTTIAAQVFNAFPPKITAQCSDGGITFSVVRPRPAESLWEVGFDHEPLTSQLAAERGYRLHDDGRTLILEVPVFSIGYKYEDISLSIFYGTFKLHLRHSKTLEVQTSTTKKCLFKTEDMIICSADGTMTVVATLALTWPTVQPERTSLLDPSCRPEQADGSRVLFGFKLDSCGTRTIVGNSYVLYENEILHDRQLGTDGPNFISRESQFKLTVRCFYPLGGVNRLAVDRMFTSQTPGSGPVKMTFKDPANEIPANDCSQQVNGNANDVSKVQEHQQPGNFLQPKQQPNHLITGPGSHDKLLVTNKHQSAHAYHVPVHETDVPGHLSHHRGNRHAYGPPRYAQQPLLRTPGLDFGVVTEESPETEDGSAFTAGQTEEAPGLSRSTNLTWSTSPLAQMYFIKQNVDKVSSMAKMDLPLLGGDRRVHQPQIKNPSVPVFQTPAQRRDHLGGTKLQLPNRVKDFVPVNIKAAFSDSAGDLEVPSRHVNQEHETSNFSLKKAGFTDTGNIQSRVQNIRVKPPRKLLSSAHYISQKSSGHNRTSQSGTPSQYSRDLAKGKPEGDQHTSGKPPEHGWPHTEGAHKSAVHLLTVLSPNQRTQNRPPTLINQQGSQELPVNNVANSQTSVGQQPASSHAEGELGETRLQNVERPSGKSYPKTAGPDTPSTGGRTASTGLGPDLMSLPRSDCADDLGRHDASTHQGIMRG